MAQGGMAVQPLPYVNPYREKAFFLEGGCPTRLGASAQLSKVSTPHCSAAGRGLGGCAVGWFVLCQPLPPACTQACARSSGRSVPGGSCWCSLHP